MKILFFSAMTTFVLFFTTVTAQAASFNFEYNGTISAFTSNRSLSPGQAAKVTVALDNGGSSVLAQTWTAADLQSVTFDFNNGSLVTTFNSPFDGGLTQGEGAFVTDGTGLLTAVMSNWNDFNVNTDFVSNGAVGNSLWILNGALVVYEDISGNIFLNNISSMLDPGRWSEVSDSAVPLPAAVWLFMGGIAGLGSFRKRNLV